MPETVYDKLLEGGTVEDETPIEPCPVTIELVDRDPRKVTTFCDCGEEAAYAFKVAGRIIPLCPSSECIRKALPKAERWYKAAQSKSWEMLTADQDILNPPKPKLSVREEIMQFQQEAKLEVTGTLDEATMAQLRARGRSGMIPIWSQVEPV